MRKLHDKKSIILGKKLKQFGFIFFQCFSRANAIISFIDLRIVLGSSTSPAETIALANSCSVTNVANLGFEVFKSCNFLIIGCYGLISKVG